MRDTSDATAPLSAARRLPALPAAAVAIALVAAPPSGAAQEGFHLERLAPGVWSAEVVERPPFYAFANSLVVEGDDGLLVVDTQQSPSAARDLIAALRAVSPRPVRRVVNSHAHGDHVYGNQAYLAAFPDVEFLASAATARAVVTETAPALAADRAALPGVVAAREATLAAGVDGEGRPLDAAARERLAYSLAVNRRQAADLADLELVVPRPVADTVVGGGRTRAHLLVVGPAHTAGDLVVWLPGERVLAVGDLVEEGLPWMEGSDPAGWARALERLVALDPAVVVPAHGTVGRGLALLRVQAALLRALVDGVDALQASGVEPDAWPGRLTPLLEPYREELLGRGPGSDRRWSAWIATAAEATRTRRLTPSTGSPR